MAGKGVFSRPDFTQIQRLPTYTEREFQSMDVAFSILGKREWL